MDIALIIDYVVDVLLHGEGISKKSDPNIIMEGIDKEVLGLLEKRWKPPTKRLNMIDFVKLMASVVPHTSDEVLFIVIGLIELYRDVLISTNSSANDVLLSDITSYICEHCQTTIETTIPERRIPAACKFQLNLDRVRQIDIDAP